MFLIDTDTWVFLLRGDAAVAAAMDRHADAPKSLSVITFGELLHGALRSAHPLENSAKVRRLGELFQVVDLTPPIMETFASLKHDLERQGTRLGDFDLMIAATAVFLGHTLVTNNQRHFARIGGLRLDNWTGSRKR